MSRAASARSEDKAGFFTQDSDARVSRPGGDVCEGLEILVSSREEALSRMCGVLQTGMVTTRDTVATQAKPYETSTCPDDLGPHYDPRGSFLVSPSHR